MAPSLADRLDRALPQTQCTRCGYPDCRAYAEAMARGEAAINRCPPGGAEGIERLATIAGVAVLTLDAACGVESPRRRAVIDEAWCIGCTLCIAACPVDCIVGAGKRMHSVVAEQCTGCELCLPACPVDCIALLPASDDRSGWAAWSVGQADESAARYRRRQARRAAAGAPGSAGTIAEDGSPADRSDAEGSVDEPAPGAAGAGRAAATAGSTAVIPGSDATGAQPATGAPAASGPAAELLLAALARVGRRQPAGR